MERRRGPTGLTLPPRLMDSDVWLVTRSIERRHDQLSRDRVSELGFARRLRDDCARAPVWR